MLAPANSPVGASKANAMLASAKKATILQELIISGVSVGGATIVTNPLDVIKTRLQLHSSAGGGGLATERPGLFRTGINIVREEGAVSLMNGMSPAVARGFLYGGMRLGLYGPCRDALQTVLARVSSSGTTTTTTTSAAQQHGLAALGLKAGAGIISGAVAAGVTSPTELIKTRLQAKGCESSSTWAVMQQVIREGGGVAALWRGSVPSMARAALLTASQLATYDTVKREVMQYSGWGDSLATHLSSSCFAGLVTTTVTNPADVIKTRMFVTGGNEARGIMQTSLEIIRNDGLSGFLKGWTANYARLGPQTVIIFLISETMRHALGLEGL